MRAFRRLLIAAACVTALPIARRDKTVDELSGLAKYLPAVGALISLILIAIACLLRAANVPPLMMSFCLTVAWIVVTGAIHLDGCMDAADGVFSHRSRERMLEIMQDSRVGNFGVLAGIFIAGGKFAALACAGYASSLLALLLLPAWARWCEVYTIGWFPYAREQGMGKIWHDTCHFKRDIWLAAWVPIALTAGAAVYFGALNALIVTIFAITSGLAAAFWLGYAVGGHTGDTYGAVVELSETGALVLASLACSFWST
jgi:adenosylcobinamide-GDP ribazoletransferase